jgi:hypothetical protein
MSKLLCPICYKLLKLLSGEDAERFRVRRLLHEAVYPVDLPEWLPEDILQKMVSSAKQDLRGALAENKAKVWMK